MSVPIVIVTSDISATQTLGSILKHFSFFEFLFARVILIQLTYNIFATIPAEDVK